MLLPETFAEMDGREYRLCVRDERRGDGAGRTGAARLLGAVSFRRSAARLTGLRLHLVPAMRRTGVGRQVVQQLLTDGTVSLSGFVDVRQEVAGAAFCEALGFRRTDGLTTVEADLQTFRRYLHGLMERGAMPEGLRTVPLADAPLAEVARLHATHIVPNGELNPWRARFAEMPGLSQSPVAVLGGKVVGMLLWEPEGELGVVRSLVGEAGAVTRWVNLLLLSTTTELIFAGGMQRVRFDFVDSNRNTRKLAQRLQATVVREIAEYTLHGAGSPEPGQHRRSVGLPGPVAH